MHWRDTFMKRGMLTDLQTKSFKNAETLLKQRLFVPKKRALAGKQKRQIHYQKKISSSSLTLVFLEEIPHGPFSSPCSIFLPKDLACEGEMSIAS